MRTLGNAVEAIVVLRIPKEGADMLLLGCHLHDRRQSAQTWSHLAHVFKEEAATDHARRWLSFDIQIREYGVEVEIVLRAEVFV